MFTLPFLPDTYVYPGERFALVFPLGLIASGLEAHVAMFLISVAHLLAYRPFVSKRYYAVPWFDKLINPRGLKYSFALLPWISLLWGYIAAFMLTLIGIYWFLISEPLMENHSKKHLRRESPKQRKVTPAQCPHCDAIHEYNEMDVSSGGSIMCQSCSLPFSLPYNLQKKRSTETTNEEE